MSESDDTATPEPVPQSTDRLYDVLSNTERRLALAYLAAADDPVALTTLSEAIATRLGDDQPERPTETDTIVVELHHWHLSKLENVGLVRYDPEARTVSAVDHPAWTSVSDLPDFDGR